MKRIKFNFDDDVSINAKGSFLKYDLHSELNYPAANIILNNKYIGVIFFHNGFYRIYLPENTTIVLPYHINAHLLTILKAV